MIYFLWIFAFFKTKFVITIVSFISITLIVRILIFLSTFLVKVQLISCHVCRSMSKFLFFAYFNQFLFVTRISSWISFRSSYLRKPYKKKAFKFINNDRLAMLYLAFPPPMPTSSASHLTFPTSCSCIRLMHKDKRVNLKRNQVKLFLIIRKISEKYKLILTLKYFDIYIIPKYAIQKNKKHLHPTKKAFGFVCVEWFFWNHVTKSYRS